MNEITKTILDSINAGAAAPAEIIAHFKNGREIKFTVSTLAMLKSDPDIAYIMDAATGEIIFNR